MIKHRISKNPIYLSAAIVLIVIIALGLFLHFHNNKDIIPSTNPVTPPSTPSADTSNQQSSSSTSNTPAASDKNPASQVPVSSQAELVAPYGTFVSDHRPSLSGTNNSPSTELSTCTTTPGASCYIKFTKGSEVKRLATQIIDGSGSTSWHWDVSQAGLSVGTWDITAVAALNGKTKTTNDTFKLEVQP